MRKQPIFKTGSLAGASDLTIIAPIKKGFIPALDAVTYKTRVKRVLKALHLGRTTSHEYDLARVLSDAVERVGRIHSIRIAVLEPEDKVMLAVTFDGAWESYIRVIWQKVSRSLDLIFCNTENYDLGWNSSFETWCNWLRKHQAESPFFYATPGLTFQDAQYLHSYERLRRRTIDAVQGDEHALKISVSSAERISDTLIDNGIDPSNSGLGSSTGNENTYTKRQAFRQGMRSLAGLYRLAEWHLPDTDDGKILKNATVELLREFAPMAHDASGGDYGEAVIRARRRFKNAMDWFVETTSDPGREVPPPPTMLTVSPESEVQAGILKPIEEVTDGCLIFLSFTSAQAFGEFLGLQKPTSATVELKEGTVTTNLALTIEGLYLAGYSDDEISQLPEEFVQGMEKRAGVLGDVRHNHPHRWNRPALNWNDGVKAADLAANASAQRIDFSAVHAVVQLRLIKGKGTADDNRKTLLDVFSTRCKKLVGNGVVPLSIQWMARLANAHHQTREHFGFLDSASQPVYNDSEKGTHYPNLVHAGEVLWGYANAADEAKPQAALSEMQKLLFNGSFLVVRKLRQDIEALESALAVAAEITKDAQKLQDQDLPEIRRTYLAKMMGRWPDDGTQAGEPLANVPDAAKPNDFNFSYDPKGMACPFHAHIRRANPRSPPELNEDRQPPPGDRPARIVRRGMSYGPKFDSAANNLEQERGLIFMAYNASIGEQFEVIQRWLTGGNSSGSYSGQSDPFLGVAETGRQRYFEFLNDGKVVRMALDGSDSIEDAPAPIVRLEWGVYLFAPSIPALEAIAKKAQSLASVLVKAWCVERGEREIARLRRIEASEGTKPAFEAWKAAVEDPMSSSDFATASLWAAIRAKHAGVLKTPFGVLVASKKLIDAVLKDETSLTATGYLPRMQRSFGPLYLGLDGGLPDQQYEMESEDANAAIMDLTSGKKLNEVIDKVRDYTKNKLTALATQARADALSDEEIRWEVAVEAREIFDSVLADMCEKWFGLSEQGEHLQRSGMRWNWKPGVKEDPPCYPGHFMAPSRYVFQPHPGPEVERVGAMHGKALSAGVTNYLKAYGASLTAPVAKAILKSQPAKSDPTYAARTLAGVLMGFLPTTDGNLRRILNEWLTEGTLWVLRDLYAKKDLAYERVFCTNLVQAMQLRAAPELLWRTAVASHDIGPPKSQHRVAVEPGDFVVASLISASQECLEKGDADLTYAFGGDRSKAGSHPRHACPGYGPAMAVIFGVFKGLVESDLALRPGPAPLSLWMDGASGFVPKQPDGLKNLELFEFKLFKKEGEGQLAKLIPVMKFGDSWMTDFNRDPSKSQPGDGPPTDKPSRPVMLAASLRRIGGFDADTEFANQGWKLEYMANKKLTSFTAAMVTRIGQPDEPKAIFISGGGNDLTSQIGFDKPRTSRLFGLLKLNAQTAATALDQTAVGKFIDELKVHLTKICNEIVKAQNNKNVKIPILISAYDYPYVDNRALMYLGQHGPWLKPVFDEAKIVNDMPIRNEVMRSLIRDLNKMVSVVADQYPHRVHHMDLRETLEKQPDFTTDYKKYWDNELHPTEVGCITMAHFVITELKKLGIT